MISLAQVEGTQQFSYVNIGRMVTAGAQADVTYSVDELDVTLGGVLAAVTASTDGTELSPTQWTPQAKLQLRWATPLLDLSLNSFLKYAGKSVRTVQTATSELATQTADAYTMMDVTLGRSFFDRLLSVSIGCKNVLNVTTINVSDQSSIHNTGTSQPVGMGRLFTFDINVNIQ
jgi:outer membrane receptor for ferrienterochelin and colicins